MIYKKLLIRIIFLLVINFFFVNHFTVYTYAVDPDEIMVNSADELRARNISKNIRCVVCQNQSIDESNAPLAKDLRILIRKKIKEGDKDKEIYKFLTDRYGDFILLKPPFKFSTLILWIFPSLLFIIGIGVIFFHNQKSKKNQIE